MTTKCVSSATDRDDRYRNIPESDIVGMLMLLGWAYEIESGEAEKASKEILQHWIEKGLEFRRGANGERRFDPVEVCNFPKQANLGSFFSNRLIHTNRRLVSDLAEASPSGGSRDGEKRFVVDFKRTFNLRSIAMGSKLRLRMPLPLIGEYLKDLKVVPFIETEGEAPINITAGRLQARMIASGAPEVTLGATLSFTARLQEPRPGDGKIISDSERALYLSESEGLIVVSDRIRALAKSLAEMETPALEAVRLFLEYIRGKLRNCTIQYDPMDFVSPCDWVLDSGLFDCQMGAALLVALCRAQGIPARVLGGYLLHQRFPAKHYWAEVWIEDQGWTPFDFLSLSIAGDGYHCEWQDRFFGRLEYRMTCERLPREFTGALGVPVPKSWCLLQVPKAGAIEISFLDINGTPVYADTVRVHK